jgi:hypothetical protein
MCQVQAAAAQSIRKPAAATATWTPQHSPNIPTTALPPQPPTHTQTHLHVAQLRAVWLHSPHTGLPLLRVSPATQGLELGGRQLLALVGDALGAHVQRGKAPVAGHRHSLRHTLGHRQKVRGGWGAAGGGLPPAGRRVGSIAGTSAGLGAAAGCKVGAGFGGGGVGDAATPAAAPPAAPPAPAPPPPAAAAAAQHRAADAAKAPAAAAASPAPASPPAPATSARRRRRNARLRPGRQRRQGPLRRRVRHPEPCGTAPPCTRAMEGLLNTLIPHTPGAAAVKQRQLHRRRLPERLPIPQPVLLPVAVCRLTSLHQLHA